MRYLLQVCFSASAVLAAGAANANEELIKMSQNPKDWVMPTQDFHPNRNRPFRACVEAGGRCWWHVLSSDRFKGSVFWNGEQYDSQDHRYTRCGCCVDVG